MRNDSPLVTYYHSVAPAVFPGWSLNFLTMEMVRFEDQMKYIMGRGWKPIFLDEWWQIRNGKAHYRGNEICITFDDGLLDNWVYAYPIVKKYGLKMTVFVCPELIEATDRVRPTLEDVWEGRNKEHELVGLGHLSWGELRAMQRSGHVDIQSHTMSHAKFIVSDALRGFHYGGFPGHHPTVNSYTLEEKPYYMSDKDHHTRVPWGTPLFEETSSVIAHRKRINESFYTEARALAGEHDLAREDERKAYEDRVRELHQRYKKDGTLLLPHGTFTDHVERVEYEIIGSKRVIEKELDKPVEFLCWPHGDNNLSTHAIAKEAGYLATTVGGQHYQVHQKDRIPRIGTDWPIGNRLARLKFQYKMARHLGQEPYHSIAQLNDLKNRMLNRS